MNILDHKRELYNHGKKREWENWKYLFFGRFFRKNVLVFDELLKCFIVVEYGMFGHALIVDEHVVRNQRMLERFGIVQIPHFVLAKCAYVLAVRCPHSYGAIDRAWDEHPRRVYVIYWGYLLRVSSPWLNNYRFVVFFLIINFNYRLNNIYKNKSWNGYEEEVEILFCFWRSLRCSNDKWNRSYRPRINAHTSSLRTFWLLLFPVVRSIENV